MAASSNSIYSKLIQFVIPSGP